MKPRDLLKTTLLAALTAAPLLAASSHSAFAQSVVAATCPDGYTLTGNGCTRSSPIPSCPSGYAFSNGKCITATKVSTRTVQSTSNGPWAFITRTAFGVKKAAELDGADFCAVSGSPSAEAAAEFFKDNDLTATHVKVDNTRTAVKKYQKYDCDILVVAKRAASSTVKSLEPKNGHLVLPEQIGTASVETPAPVVAAIPVTPVPAPAPTPPSTTVNKQPTPPPATVKKRPTQSRVAKRKRCSAVRYGYTSGNTCRCAGGRVFTGSRCVRPRRW